MTIRRVLVAALFGGSGAAFGHYLGGYDAALAIGGAATIVALPFSWTHPRRADEVPSGYVSWYETPHGSTFYLRHYPAGNIAQEYYSEGYEYVAELGRASVFENEADAIAVTPTYNGNTRMKAGVFGVFGRKPTRAHIECCETCSTGGDCSAHQTFPPEEVTSTYVKDLMHNRCPIDGRNSIVLTHNEREPSKMNAKCTFCRSRWVVSPGKARHVHDYDNYQVERVE